MSDLKAGLKSIKSVHLVWRYGFNLVPTLSYEAATKEKLSVDELAVVTQLDQDGFAMTSIDALVDTLQFNELERAVAGLLAKKSEEIEKLKLNASSEDSIGSKTFNLELLGGELWFDAEDVFARFALNESLIRIANAYFRMYSKLRYYNVWKTFASNGAARESQLWHFDREDKYILKVFLYMDDVDDGGGPFTYASGTHKKGKYRKIKPEFFMEGGVRRTTDAQMRDVFPEENWVKCIGKKGTIIFADTRGYHKGGEVRNKDRLMYTCMFTSQASDSKRLIKFGPDIDTSSLSKKQIKALLIS